MAGHGRRITGLAGVHGLPSLARPGHVHPWSVHLEAAPLAFDRPASGRLIMAARVQSRSSVPAGRDGRSAARGRSYRNEPIKGWLSSLVIVAAAKDRYASASKQARMPSR